ncbi:protein FAM83H isoform X2 [Cololabis saira]|uniref:protein FAM83H isoform X2 n=1 Tax=Cololabis saira TaxID=129043 RepID=UPI002AD2D5C8|nr:protein FAM83H isoform X2 [Cololabis saira]
MAHRSQCSSIGDNPLDPNYLPPHYREEYRLGVDALIENDIQGYHEFLQAADIVGFLSLPEIEYIRSKCQGPTRSSNVPELMYHEGGQDVEGSSDTYWPLQSDMAAPGLDLGWPISQPGFIGPTEVTTLVNPSDPDMPSIKEQARRLIKNARQVVAVVMDVFTDVDLFADLLDATARNVPVYILLDEENAHHFVSMIINGKVNLDSIPMMRVRTVPGITYQSRTGKSFKGQVKDRFLLSDCRAVLSGNYSFTWSYEKIHRCIAHLFLGELVNTFDEEFRILFAQSEPLVVDPSSEAHAVPNPNSSMYYSSQIGLKRTQSLRNPIGIHSALPYGDSDHNPALGFRRNDPFRHTIEPGPGITIGKYSQQQFRMQQSYIEQGRSIVSRQMELSSSGYKRHSYAEGTQENYSSSRQFMKHRVMNNLDETEMHREQIQSSQYYTEGPGPGSGHGHYERLRGRQSPLAIDQYSNSSYRSDQEPPPGKHGTNYFSSEDLRGPEEMQAPPLAGRYGGSYQRRPTLGQSYACQSSPTQPHPPEKKSFYKQPDQEHDQDSTAKEGMRNWRIHSYLNTCEDAGEEGLRQPLGPDAFDEPPTSQQLTAAESSAPHFRLKEPPTITSKPRPDILAPRFGKPKLPETTNKDSTLTRTRGLLSSLGKNELEKEKERETDRSGVREDGEAAEGKGDVLISRHESIRSRINPMLQRSSRLRSSLIFSSSKGEMHSGSLGLTPATEEDEELDAVRTSSIVTQILEKKKAREAFQWRKKADEKEEKEKEKEKRKDVKEEQQQEKQMHLTDEIKSKEEALSINKEDKTKQSVEKSDVTTATNMNDPASRLLYFKELAAKRKASKMEMESLLKVPEPAEKKPDLSDTPPLKPTATQTAPDVTVSSTESKPKKLDIAAKLGELTRRPSVSSSKPPIITAKPFVSSRKLSETDKEESASGDQKKDIFKSLKALPSPKLFRKDQLKFKGLTSRRISSGEEFLVTDATDAEKSELKKSRSHSSSAMTHEEAKEGRMKAMGSNTSINTIGEGKGEGKTLDFLKKQTQRLKGFLGPKDKEKRGDSSSRDPVTADQPTTNHKTSAGTSGSSSQKNRQEREEAGGDKDGAATEKGLDVKNRFLRQRGNTLEREGLLQRIESLRKEKKVYSRFEMGNSLA